MSFRVYLIAFTTIVAAPLINGATIPSSVSPNALQNVFFARTLSSSVDEDSYDLVDEDSYDVNNVDFEADFAPFVGECEKDCLDINDNCTFTTSGLSACKIGLMCDPFSKKCVSLKQWWDPPAKAAACNASISTPQCGWGRNTLCDSDTDTCKTYLYPGDSCTKNEDCLPQVNGICNIDNVCVGRKKGETCNEMDLTSPGPCDFDTVCVSGICEERVPIGGACNSTAGQFCVLDALCSAESNKCVQYYSILEGKRCDVDYSRNPMTTMIMASSEACEPRLVCIYEDTAANSGAATCRRRENVARNTPCNSTASANETAIKCSNDQGTSRASTQCTCNPYTGKDECISTQPSFAAAAEAAFACSGHLKSLHKCLIDNKCLSSFESNARLNQRSNSVCATKHCKLLKAAASSCQCGILQDFAPPTCISNERLEEYLFCGFVWHIWMIVLLIFTGCVLSAIAIACAIQAHRRRKRANYRVL